jgi:putative transposase
MKRRDPFINDNLYHVMNKSIAGYEIFNSKDDFIRITQMLRFFSLKERYFKFSQLVGSVGFEKKGFEQTMAEIEKNQKNLVEIIAYCIMPTHFHILVKQTEDGGVSNFVGCVSNSYARYFNNKYNRKGHLWSDKFKSVIVDSDEQLLHLTRYIHLNPVTAGIVEDPSDWKWSSYDEYAGLKSDCNHLCNFKDLINMSFEDYSEFVNDRKDYQRELAKIKKIAIE